MARDGESDPARDRTDKNLGEIGSSTGQFSDAVDPKLPSHAKARPADRERRLREKGS
jgi:hypothetical protein